MTVTDTSGLFGILAFGVLFVVALVGFARVLPPAEELPEEPTLGVADIQFRLDHTDAQLIRDAEHAHAVMQRHINCDAPECPAKRSAVVFLERAGKLRRDSSRT